MTEEELEKKAEEYAEKQQGVFRFLSDHIKFGFLAGAKEMLKENEELRLKWLQATDEGTSWANLKSRENEIEELRQQIEQMKNCLSCKFGDLGEDNIWCYNKERYGSYDAKKGCKHWELAE